jgi:hypothetical protein
MIDSVSGQRLQPMTMKMALATVLLAVLISAGHAEDTAAPPTGVLEAQELVYDAGKVERGSTVRHAFVLKNVGPGELSVDAKPG